MLAGTELLTSDLHSAIKNDRGSALHCGGVPQQNDVLPHLKAKD
jgi:hypothetical protein